MASIFIFVATRRRITRAEQSSLTDFPYFFLSVVNPIRNTIDITFCIHTLAMRITALTIYQDLELQILCRINNHAQINEKLFPLARKPFQLKLGTRSLPQALGCLKKTTTFLFWRTVHTLSSSIMIKLQCYQTISTEQKVKPIINK